MAALYKDYFNISPKYHAQVTADLIAQGEVSWKDFYPHETFVRLLETTNRVLSGAAPRSIWVEGAYGTGKSHAALTVKSIIDAPNDEVREYFEEYGLSRDLCNKLISLKNSGKILTIHRIGSADINTDTDLILAVQQSVMSALHANGIENEGEASMRDSFLSWLEKPGSRVYFDTLIHDEQYSWEFGGMTADDVEQRLKTGTDSQVEALMRRVMKVLKGSGQYGIFSDVNDMVKWIKSIIEENRLTAILFIWDEFSEYIRNHPVALTGFQTLLEISQSNPFYFMIVAHESENLFSDRDTAKKTMDRFEKPPIKIEMPENMAFQLMAQAMKTTSDSVLSREWERDYKPALNEELAPARAKIIAEVRKQPTEGKKTVISDEELQAIVPIHPYAALILKHISTVFNSNQRSMFDFIISDEDNSGFKWFIKQNGPLSKTYNLLTVDQLWDFFYGKGRVGLNDNVKGVLESYYMIQPEKLDTDEQRVLKTVLLLQALSLSVQDIELVVPNEENLELAFSGTDWYKGKATYIANSLIEKRFLFQRLLAGGKYEYCVARADFGEDVTEYRKKAEEETNTQNLIINGSLQEAVVLPAAIKKRFITEGYATGKNNFHGTLQKLQQKPAAERFKVLTTFAIDDAEEQQIRQLILEAVKAPGNDIIFIESLVPMGEDLYKQYVDALAYSMYYSQKDHGQAIHYDDQAGKILRDWKAKISSGAFMLYDADRKGGERKANLADLQYTLSSINHAKYYYGLEQYPLTNTMYETYNLAEGAGCGIEQNLKGSFKNPNKNLSFEKALAGAWKVDKYWEKSATQGLPIVHIKKKVDGLIKSGFASDGGRVSIMSIWDELERAPYGFMPSAVAAFVMGFVLKEYCNGEFFWSNGRNNEAMTKEKMKSMIANAIKHRENPSTKYDDEYIVEMTPEIRSFLKCTAKAFGIPESQCGSVESARDHVRIKMKDFSFPLWCVKYILDKTEHHCDSATIEKIIDNYMGIANTANSDRSSENELAERIGKTAMEQDRIVDDLSSLFTSDNCREGMISFISQFQGGILPKLAKKIHDGGSYIDRVKARFNAGDANWVWNISTAEEKISDVILEYQIISESNKTLGHYSSINEVVNAWNSRTNNIKIPCEVVAKLTGDLGPLLWELYHMKQNDGIAEQHRQKFYDLLFHQRENFDKFYRDQLPYFKQDAEAFLNGLTDSEIEELYNGFAEGQFTKQRSDYYKYVESEVAKFIQGQWKKKLRDLWFEKTKTKDPIDWSEKYTTPILCMFDDGERPKAKQKFDILISSNPSEAEANEVIDYLEKADFYGRLSDEKERDRCFRLRIVGKYSVLLKDLSDVRKNLSGKVYERPYDWFNNISVQNQLKKMADKQYKLNGADRAMQVIDKMDTDQLRTYLREKIQDDLEFGVQILKNEG